jgi:hypothetical protein
MSFCCIQAWQPAWGIRLILEALISFFPTAPNGALGSLEWSPVERQRLARVSMHYSCPKCGNAAATLPALTSGDAAATAAAAERTLQYKQQLGQLHLHELPSAAATTTATNSSAKSDNTQSNSVASSTNGSASGSSNGTGESRTVGSSGSSSTQATVVTTAVSDSDTAVDKLLLALEAMFCAVIVLILAYKGLRFFGVTA